MLEEWNAGGGGNAQRRVTGGGVRNAMDRLLRTVSERSNSKLMSTGECMESGEFGELPEGDKGGAHTPTISQRPER